MDNATLRVEVERESRLQVPLHHLSSVVCLGNVNFSTPLAHRLADEGIALVLLDGNGRFKARLEGPVSGNVLLRQAQHRRGGDADFVLDTARACVAGKIRNARQVLLRGAREAKHGDEGAQLARGDDDLAAALRGLPLARTLDEVRGLEGDAARRYFERLSLLLRAETRADFRMNGRTRRPARDRFNALISFIYSMWMNDCRSALEVVGLDPQLGFLHAVRPGRAALALDLMEEFRPLADRLALTLINRSQVTSASGPRLKHERLRGWKEFARVVKLLNGIENLAVMANAAWRKRLTLRGVRGNTGFSSFASATCTRTATRAPRRARGLKHLVL